MRSRLSASAKRCACVLRSCLKISKRSMLDLSKHGPPERRGTGMTELNQNSSISVDIYDQTYHLRGQDTEYIRRLADMVDGKMRAVAAHGKTVDSLRVAVLAALNIADELVTLERKYLALTGEAGQEQGS